MEDFVDINMNGGFRSNYEISFRGIVATQIVYYTGKWTIFTAKRRRFREAACAAPRFLLRGWLRTAVFHIF